MQEIPAFADFHSFRTGTVPWPSVVWPVSKVNDLEPGAHGLDSALYRHNSSGALGRHIQVVGDGASCYFQYLGE